MEFVYVYLAPVSEAVGGCILRRHGIDLLLMERQNFLPVQGSFIFEVEMVRLDGSMQCIDDSLATVRGRDLMYYLCISCLSCHVLSSRSDPI
jgi:hypothetical protein